jgi:hypothetical protein
MSITPLAKLSSVTQPSAFLTNLTPAHAGSTLTLSRAQPAPTLTLKGNPAAAPLLTDWTEPTVKFHKDANLIDYSTQGKLPNVWSDLALPPKTRSAMADLTATSLAGIVRFLLGSGFPKSQLNAIGNAVSRVVRDVCANSKPGDDLLGKLRAAIGLTLWGAGVAPDQIADLTNTLFSYLGPNFAAGAHPSLADVAQFFFKYPGWLPIDFDLNSINWP